MTAADGFFGRVLLVDLSQGTIETKSLPSDLYREVLGGYGLGVRLLLEWMPAGADPLGPDNVLGFVPGLLTGSGVPFSGRFMVVGKSPLTGGWGDANCGGRFGPALRASGVDGVFVTGASSHPVYLSIDEDGATLKDANHLWGFSTTETETRIKEEEGRGARVVSIGPAGEKCALIAALIHDGGRAAARSGLGAVMGAKKLKAVVAQGSLKPSIYDKDALRDHRRTYLQIFKEEPSFLARNLTRFTGFLAPLMRLLRVKPSGGPTDALINVYREYGTCAGTAFSTEIGDAPVQNWRGIGNRDFPMSRSAFISGDAVIQHQVKKYHCHSCPVGCGGIVHLEGERYSIEEAHKPEYETLAAFGSLLLNDDLESIIEINTICDRYGLDTISTGAVVAFALECAEAGLVDREIEDGLTLRWGDADAIVALVRQIARRERLGDLLADGVQHAAQAIGPETEPFAIHAGGQELPMHDSRYEPLLGLAYAVDPTPGRHNVANGGIYDAPIFREVFATEGFTPPGRYEYEGKGTLFALLNRYLQIVNCAGLCEFSLLMGKPPIREWINAATGWDLSLEDLLHVGHRIQVLRHLFNLHQGTDSLEWTLPDRAQGRPPFEHGPLKGVTLDIESMIQDFFRAMGYDEVTGIPTDDTRALLGLTGLKEEVTR